MEGLSELRALRMYHYRKYMNAAEQANKWRNIAMQRKGDQRKYALKNLEYAMLHYQPHLFALQALNSCFEAHDSAVYDHEIFDMCNINQIPTFNPALKAERDERKNAAVFAEWCEGCRDQRSAWGLCRHRLCDVMTYDQVFERMQRDGLSKWQQHYVCALLTHRRL